MKNFLSLLFAAFAGAFMIGSSIFAADLRIPPKPHRAPVAVPVGEFSIGNSRIAEEHEEANKMQRRMRRQRK